MEIDQVNIIIAKSLDLEEEIKSMNQNTFLRDVCGEYFDNDWENMIHYMLRDMSPQQFDDIKKIYGQFHHDK